MSFNYDDYIDRLIQKDDLAFQAIYEASKRIIYAIIRQKVKDPNTIEDLMQETYIKAIRHIKSYAKNGKFIKWIGSIAHNTVMDYYRSQDKISIQSEETLDLKYKTNPVNHENQALVNSLLKILDPIEFTIVISHVVDGLTFKDISVIVDKPLGTVLWLYQIALKKMRTEALK